MRGVMIGAGVAVISEFEWVLYILGIFLVFSGVKMLFSGEDDVHPEKNIVVRLVRKFYPVAADFDGQRFITHFNGRRALTPLALVLLCVETTDLIFAVDSIPAIFAVTQKPFIVFTSNVCAILGLRSLYFVLAGAIEKFHYLHLGLGLVLTFVGIKMLLAHSGLLLIPTAAALGIVAGILVLSVVASILKPRQVDTVSPGA